MAAMNAWRTLQLAQRARFYNAALAYQRLAGGSAGDALAIAQVIAVAVLDVAHAEAELAIRDELIAVLPDLVAQLAGASPGTTWAFLSVARQVAAELCAELPMQEPGAARGGGTPTGAWRRAGSRALRDRAGDGAGRPRDDDARRDGDDSQARLARPLHASATDTLTSSR